MEPATIERQLTAEHAPPSTPTHRVRAIVLVALVGALLVLAWSPPVHRAVLQVFEAAKELITVHPMLGAALFVVLSALAAMLAFFSSAVLVPAAGAFVVKVNGAVQSPTIANGYARLRRRWQRGDIVKVEMQMPPRRVTSRRNPSKPSGSSRNAK